MLESWSRLKKRVSNCLLSSLSLLLFDKCQPLMKETQQWRYWPSVFFGHLHPWHVHSFVFLVFLLRITRFVSGLRWLAVCLSIVNWEANWTDSFLLNLRLKCLPSLMLTPRCNRRANWRLSLISTLLNCDHRCPTSDSLSSHLPNLPMPSSDPATRSHHHQHCRARKQQKIRIVSEITSKDR